MSNDLNSPQAPSSDGGGSADALSRLVALVERNRSAKTWPRDDIKEATTLFSEVAAKAASRPDEVERAVGLAQELPVTSVESAVEKRWPSLDQEARERWVTELLKHDSSRGLTRQVAVAAKIAKSDKSNAAQMLYSFASGGKADGDEFWPRLSQEKKLLLQSRFFNSGEWVYFKSDDERVMRALLGAFVEASFLSESAKNKKSLQALYDFARWAVSTQRRLKLDPAVTSEIAERIASLAQEFTEERRSLLDSLYGGQIAARPRAAQPTTEGAIAGQPEATVREKTFVGNESANQTDGGRPGGVGRAEPETVSARAKRLLERRRAFVNILREGLASAQDDNALLAQLVEAFAVLEQEKASLESRLSQAEKVIEGIKSDGAARDADLSAARAEAERLRSVTESMEARLRQATADVEQERAARTAERRDLEEEAGRSSEVKLNGFKWKLSQSLRPVFENKRNTDGQEPSPRLADFLRDWFDKLEARLEEAGVSLKQDI